MLFKKKKAETTNIDFDDVFEAEKRELDIKSTTEATGLALSGGGIRSASFGLGVIQALLEHRIMQKIDYLSTVSGGGYIGASLTLNRSLVSDPDSYLTPPNSFGEKGRGVRSQCKPTEQKNPNEKGNQTGEPEEQKKTDEKENKTDYYTFLSYIRQHGNYLSPSKGMSLLSAVGVALRNLFISFFIYFSLLLIAVSFWAMATNMAARGIDSVKESIGKKEVSASLEKSGVEKEVQTAADGEIDSARPHAADDSEWMRHSFFYINLIIAAVILFLWLLYGLWFSFISYQWPSDDQNRPSSSYACRNRFQEINGKFLFGFLAFTLLALVPPTYALFNSLFSGWIIEVGIVGVVSGMGAALSKFRKFLGGKAIFKLTWIGDRLFEISAFVFLFVAVIFAYHLCLEMKIPLTVKDDLQYCPLIYLVPLAAFTAFFGFHVNINFASLGRMYRDRLMEAFLPDTGSIEKNKWGEANDSDSKLLADMCKEPEGKIRRPYHLINTNVILTNSEDARYRNRGGDSFILSPLFCGSNATGFDKTERFMKKRDHQKGGMTLATAMAISGAAVNPHTGVAGKGPTRRPLVSMLMTIFNLRLGAWVSNPKSDGFYQPMNYFRPGLCSLLGFGYDEKKPLLELTDGGHFENLGLYELVKRRVGTIIVSDAAVDKDFKFGDLANAIEKVRTDFGVSIRFEPENDHLNRLLSGTVANGKLSERYEFAAKGYIQGTIKYPQTINDEAFEGKIFLLKTTMIKDLPADLYSYKAQHEDFPDQPTTDQFFDEKQFEAYRELGYRIADSMCNETASKHPIV